MADDNTVSLENMRLDNAASRSDRLLTAGVVEAEHRTQIITTYEVEELELDETGTLQPCNQDSGLSVMRTISENALLQIADHIRVQQHVNSLALVVMDLNFASQATKTRSTLYRGRHMPQRAPKRLSIKDRPGKNVNSIELAKKIRTLRSQYRTGTSSATRSPRSASMASSQSSFTRGAAQPDIHTDQRRARARLSHVTSAPEGHDDFRPGSVKGIAESVLRHRILVRDTSVLP